MKHFQFLLHQRFQDLFLSALKAARRLNTDDFRNLMCKELARLLCAQSFSICKVIFSGLNWFIFVTQISDAENVNETSLKAFDYASDIASLVQGSSPSSEYMFR